LTEFRKIIVVFDFYWIEVARTSIPKQQNYLLIAFDPLVLTFSRFSTFNGVKCLENNKTPYFKQAPIVEAVMQISRGTSST